MVIAGRGIIFRRGKPSQKWGFFAILQTKPKCPKAEWQRAAFGTFLAALPCARVACGRVNMRNQQPNEASHSHEVLSALRIVKMRQPRTQPGHAVQSQTLQAVVAPVQARRLKNASARRLESRQNTAPAGLF